MSDEMEGGPLIGALFQLGRHLLDPVFSQDINSGRDGLPAGRRVIHLAGTHQRDLLGVTPHFPAYPGNLRPHLRNILCNGHALPTSLL